ncbi:MAG: imidazolonepropionase [candidate division WOR-3 bacterium]|nr:imidazolonepropionase [candidate division WOR-3 bacterium]MCX7836936.1 imidazolonepropionase [candidate division WOR-3 bacterium]MDW8114137.1 imidazolonepropionase [candidate division WOR-3 bacterium]
MILIKNISQLLLMDKPDFKIIEKAYLLIKGDKIYDFGEMEDLKLERKSYQIIDAQNCCVLPGFIDSHTHLFFSGTREDELEMRLNKASYYEILEKGGGIYYTHKKTKEKKDKELFEENYRKLLNVIKWGTTTIEIKSGYGIYPKEELRHLKIINQLKKKLKDKITILPTFLIHVVPQDIERKKYILLMKKTMEIIAKKKLAIFCDVFCEKGENTFNKKESIELLSYGKKLGLIPKIHANELSSSYGDYVAYKIGCISAEHLIYPEIKNLKLMKKKDVVATLLPGTSFFLRMAKKPPIDIFKKLNIKIALASDYNPGTCPIYQMPIIISLGAFLYGFNEKESLYYGTMGNAYALNLQDKIGSIEKGKEADLIILKYDKYQKIFYNFPHNPIKKVFKKGKIVFSNE